MGLVTGANPGILILDFDGPQGLATLDQLGLSPHVPLEKAGQRLTSTRELWD